MSNSYLMSTVFGSRSGGNSVGAFIGSLTGNLLGGFIGGGASGEEPWYTLGKADDTDPSLWADFANDRYAVNGAEEAFTDIFTFTRSTTGTYFDANGVMQTAAINTPRFNHDPATGEKLGLLIEEQRTNLVSRSGDIVGYWGKDNVTATSDGTLAPDGLPATKITTVGLLGNRVVSPDGISLTATTYAISVFIKPDTSRVCQIELDFANPNIAQTIDFDNLTTNDLAVGNGWYRCTRYFTQAGASFARITIRPSLTVGGSIYASLVQVEQGSFATSYIPTTTSAVTRSADYVANSGSNNVPFASWYNQSAGTLYADLDDIQYQDSKWLNAVAISDGTSYNLVRLAGYGNVFGSDPIVTSGTIQYIPSPQYPYTAHTRIKGAIAATSNDAKSYYNAYALAGGTSVIMPAVTRMYVGRKANGASVEMMSGTIRELRYYPIRVTDLELQRITTP